MPSQVFHTGPLEKVKHPIEWAPLESGLEAEDLLYTANNSYLRRPQDPALRLAEDFGKTSLQFECFLLGLCTLFLLDSGATHSFLATRFCDAHGIRYKRYRSHASLANGSSVPVVGILKDAHLKISSFRCKETLLVVDNPDYDVVLGMDFLTAHDPTVRLRKRLITLPVPGGHTTVKCHQEESLPKSTNPNIEICSMSAFARSLQRADNTVDLKNAILAAIVPDSTGVGSDHPLISPLLDEYSDVFATEIPGGLPPERTGIDGKPIQHEIHTDPDVKPFARSPPPAYAKEMEALRDYLKDFLAKNWISPSLSPWAAPVCSSPKRWTL